MRSKQHQQTAMELVYLSKQKLLQLIATRLNQAAKYAKARQKSRSFAQFGVQIVAL